MHSWWFLQPFRVLLEIFLFNRDAKTPSLNREKQLSPQNKRVKPKLDPVIRTVNKKALG
jgi:hypothetical protein